MSKPARLSVCLIVKNEARHLARCLESVTAIASECLVIDTGSTDQTVAIARQLGAQVHHLEWQNDFAQARNFALQQAQGDWVLMLDGDEFVDPESLPALQALLEQPPPAPALISVRIQHLDDQGQIQRIDFSSRLYTRHPDIRYRYAFHERLQMPASIYFERLPAIKIQHLGYAQAQMQHQAKTERDLTYLTQMSQRYPEQTVWTCYRADVYFAAGDYAQALPLYLECLNEASPQQTPPQDEAQRYLPHALQRALRCQLELQHNQAGLALAQRFPYLASLLPGYWYALGQLQRRQQAYAAAIQSFAHCLEFKACEAQINSYDPAEISYLPLIQMTQIYRSLMLQPGLGAPQQAQAAREMLELIEILLVLFPEGEWSSEASHLYLWSAEACWIFSHTRQLALSEFSWPRQVAIYRQVLDWQQQSLQLSPAALEVGVLQQASQSYDAAPVLMQSLLRITLLALRRPRPAQVLLQLLKARGQEKLAQQQWQEMALIVPELLASP